MKTNDGGPAFPVEFSTAGWHSGNVNVGMTLRDWFAGMVIQGWFAGDEGLRTATRLPSYAGAAEYDWDTIAAQAGKLADAMIAERERTTHE